MTLRRYVLGRFLQMVPTVLLIVVFNFFLIHLAPGDPVQIMAGDFATQEFIDATRAKYGLDDPLYVQLLRYLAAVFTGDLGHSYDHNRPVLDLILDRLPATLTLVLSAQIIGVTLGITLGVAAAQRHGSLLDTGTTMLAAVLYSVPVFWAGLMGILIFGVNLRWLPTSGMSTLMGPTSGLPYVIDVARHLVMPAATLVAVWIGPVFFRISRSSVLEVLREDYILTARAKGLPRRVVFFKHALRNALLPSVTMIGLTLGLAVSGALLTETVFSWPGIGRLMYEGIGRRDYPLLMGIFIFTSVSVVIATLMTDVLYKALDPRVKLA